MRLHVDLQRDLVMITLTAVRAGIRPDAFVDVIVLHQVELGLEPFGTFRALYRPGVRMRASYVLHHVGLTDEFRATQYTRVLFDAEVSFHVNHTLVLALVHFAAQFAGVAVLIIRDNVFDVIVDPDLFPVDPEQLLRVLTRLPLLLELAGVLGRLDRATVLHAAIDNRVYYPVYLRGILILQEIDDVFVNQAGTLIGKYSGANHGHVLAFIFT